MKPIQISVNHRLFAALGLGAVLVLLLLTVSQVGAQPPVPHDIVFLIDNSQSVRTGEGTPDGQPTDPALVRLRLTRFVITVLGLDPASANQHVGVISFADHTETLMPMTPVQDWSRADFAEIRAVRQGGTDFALALDAASEMLASDCSPDVRRCGIIMVTDGIFEKYKARRDQQATEDALQSLRSRGVSVHLLTFGAGDQKWQEFLTDDLISTYQPSVTSAPPDQVYGTVLRNLGAEALLAGLTPVEVVGEEIVALTVHTFRTWTRYQILPDSPLIVTFLHAGQVVTPVVVGTEYTLFQPQAGEWNVRLQGDGLAYYQQTGEGVADLSLYLRAPEGVSTLGEDVTVRAGLTADGAPVTDLTSFTITAAINDAAGIIGPLNLELDKTIGLFATTAPADRFKSGVYTVTLAAQSSVPGLGVQPVTEQFEIVALPTLAMTITPTGPIRPGQSVHVIVTVGNWRPGYVPRLRFYGPAAVSIDTPTWSTQGTGVFTGTITTTSGITSSFAIVAQLVGGAGTPAGELFDAIETTPQLVEFTTMSPVVMTAPYSMWLTIPLCALLAIGAYAWWRFYGTSRQRKRRIKQLRDEVEVLVRIVGEVPEESGAIVESWNA